MLLRGLILVDDAGLRSRIESALAHADIDLTSSRQRGHLWDLVKREAADLVVASVECLPKPPAKAVAGLHELPDRPEVVVLVEDANPARDAELVAAGALAVLHAGLEVEQLATTLESLVRRGTERPSRRELRQQLVAQPRLSDFVSRCPRMQDFLELVGRVVPTDSPLLLLGETGVGKERLARAIHHEGPRGNGPFVAVNCGAFPEGLLESELFGHVKGSFTGATQTRRGCFEIAHRGTIFLDEVGEMPLHAQIRLLRVLQEYEIQRVGAERSIPVDVRVMAATNRNLEELVADGRFRRDLFYRLAVVTLEIPPLRDRWEDIPDLVFGFLEQDARRRNRDVRDVADEALDALTRYDWPGNVRELFNVVERALLLCHGDTIGLADLPLNLVESPPPSRNVPGDEAMLRLPWSEARRQLLDEFEREYFTALLERTGGRIGETAERAGVQPRSLFEKMRRHGLRKEDFRPPRKPKS